MTFVRFFKELINALRKLNEKNLSNLTPHPKSTWNQVDEGRVIEKRAPVLYGLAP